MKFIYQVSQSWKELWLSLGNWIYHQWGVINVAKALVRVMNENHLALFRSCLRKEYRDQVIKMLRGMEGEYTRTVYRLQWIEDLAKTKILSGESVSFAAIVVDPQGEKAMPVRILHLRDFDIDPSRDQLRLTLELGMFLEIPHGFSTNLADWQDSGGSVPPDKFVSEWKPAWPKFSAVDFVDSGSAWRRSVDFLTTTWGEFENSIFLRPSPGWCDGSPWAPTSSADQSKIVRISVDSYNPHLTSAELKSRRFAVPVEGLLSESVVVPDIPKDGVALIEFRFLEFGEGLLRVEVSPDPMMSSYIPVQFVVAKSEEIGDGEIRYLGKDWRKFLVLLAERFADSVHRHEEVLDLLLDVFRDDPELCLHRGQVHMKRGEHRAAVDRFARALQRFQDPRAIVGSLVASLHVGDIQGAEYWLARLPLSDSQGFEELLLAISEIPDQVAKDFADAPVHLLSEDKALRLLSAMGDGESSEVLIKKLIGSAAELDPGYAVRMGLAHLAKHPDWIDLRARVVLLAVRNKEMHLVENFIGDALRWRGADPNEFLADFNNLGGSLQLDVYSRLAYENAARMLASNGSEAIAAGFELAITAAETAISIGDLSLASRATIMMLVKLRILGGKTEHVVSHYGVKVHELHDQVGELSVTYSHINEAATKVNQSIISQVDDDYSGKSIVVLVYGELGDDVDNLCATLLKRWEAHMARSTLQLIRSEEAHTSASNQLMAIDPRKLVVYSPHSSLRSINQQTYRWLYEHGVPILYGFATFPDIVNALHTFHSRSAAPVFTPTSCAEAVAAARRDLVNLWLAPEIDEHVVFLDGRPESTSWAKAIWRSLNALSSYAGARIVDRKVGTFRMWASANGGISAQQIKDKESEGTMNTPSLRAQRVFAVPSEFVASGSVVMESHIGIGVVMGCPRIHYCVESVDVIGRLCVGYVGQHLETLGTN